MTSYATRTQSSSEQNDLKKLKSKYSSKLSTLKELFAEWSDDDLLFVLDEADGVLEVAVDRISEGHATQWGEVKTKKAKKEAQQKAKAAAAATTPSSAQTMSYQKPERTYTERPKPTKARVPSTHSNNNNNNNNNYSRKSTTPAASSWGYNSGQKSSPSSTMDNSAGSWASIASTKPAHDSSSEWNTATITDTTTTTTTITNDSWANDDKEITGTTTSSALLDDSDKPKSWASLLKSQPKPEQSVQKQESELALDEDRNTTTTNDVHDTWNTKDDEIVKDEWNAPVETPTDAWGSNTAAVVEPVEPKVVPDSLQDAESSKLTSQLTEESPAVVASNDVDIKFGSLKLGDETSQESVHIEESLTDTKIEAQPQSQVTTEPVLEKAAPVDNFQQPTSQQQPSYLKQQEPTYSQAQVNQQSQQPAQAPAQVAQPQFAQQTQTQPQTQQVPQQFPHQPQQQQQQQPFGMDHLTSAYSSYLPNQQHTGMSGFGMSPMGNLPDYSGYGTEAQRAAAMGYYDPSAFNNSPSAMNASSYPSREKFGQDTSATLGAPQGQSTPGQSQGLHGQQMYPGMPYYPYYYMPNHYNAYQQSMYGQPMMGKNMYPNMYQQQQQQQATSATKPSTQSPYGVNGSGVSGAGAAAASPYALHSQLYNQPTSGAGGAAGVSGYDDLQQQFGLHDYQKSPYGNAGGQQLQGFLGHHLQGQQQGQQSQQQPSISASQQGQVVDPSIKNDSSRSNLASSQPQQQQHQMNNYFGQQQMFSYQQYPQQQYWNQ